MRGYTRQLPAAAVTLYLVAVTRYIAAVTLYLAAVTLYLAAVTLYLVAVTLYLQRRLHFTRYLLLNDAVVERAVEVVSYCQLRSVTVGYCQLPAS